MSCSGGPPPALVSERLGGAGFAHSRLRLVDTYTQSPLDLEAARRDDSAVDELASPDYTVKRVDAMERAFGGAFVRVRAELGVESFGIQVVDLPPNSGDISPEHDHLHNCQEEVYLLLDGSAEVALPDRNVPLDRETFVRIGPGTRRRVRTGPDGARLLMIGAVPGGVYEPQENSRLGGPETLAPTASSALIPDGPPPQLTT